MLDLYELPYDPSEPVVCLDEMNKQLLDHKIPPITLTPHYGVREDSEYIRKESKAELLNNQVGALLKVEEG